VPDPSKEVEGLPAPQTFIFFVFLWMFTQKSFAATREGIEPMPLVNGPDAD
jgi:hypothetical protein